MLLRNRLLLISSPIPPPFLFSAPSPSFPFLFLPHHPSSTPRYMLSWRPTPQHWLSFDLLLISSPTLPPFPFSAPFPSLSFPLPFPSPFFHSPARALLAPDSPAPALFRRPSGSSAPAPVLSCPQHPFSFWHVKHDRTEGLFSVLFDRMVCLRSIILNSRIKALRLVKQDRLEALRSVLSGRTVPKGRGAGSRCRKVEKRC